MKSTALKPVQPTNWEAAQVLLAATIRFLLENDIPEALVRKFILRNEYRKRNYVRSRKFKMVVMAYENMGMIMSTWYTDPAFLDSLGQPARLSTGRGPRSLGSLVRKSRVNISTSAAVALLRQSSSVHLDREGWIVPTRRTFLLPEFEIPRATIIVSRFLETLHRNSSVRDGGRSLLIERCCHASGINAQHIAPAMRDIKARGSAFMDSVDGQIEGIRTKKSTRTARGEVGVVTFAWTKILKSPKRAELAKRVHK